MGRNFCKILRRAPKSNFVTRISHTYLHKAFLFTDQLTPEERGKHVIKEWLKGSSPRPATWKSLRFKKTVVGYCNFRFFAPPYHLSDADSTDKREASTAAMGEYWLLLPCRGLPPTTSSHVDCRTVVFTCMAAFFSLFPSRLPPWCKCYCRDKS